MTTLNLAKETEKFLYKCDGHSENISQKLLNLYEKGEFCDTIIYAGSYSIEIEAHSIVLTALSDYFSEIFRCEQSGSKRHILNLQEIDASALKLCIDFLYSGCIELSLQTVENIFRTAEVLKLHDLFNVCYDFIDKHTTTQNCLDFFRLANEFKFPTLQENCLAHAYAHFQEVINQQNVMLLSEEELKDLLFYENPHEDFEELVLLCVIAWIKHDIPNRQHLELELMSMVRFQLLPPEALITNREAIRKTFSYEYLCGWIENNLSPNFPSYSLVKSLTAKPYGCEVSKLAIIYHDHENASIIASYNRTKDSWTTKRHTRQSWNRDKTHNTIVIGDKLFVVGGRIECETSNVVQSLDLADFKLTEIPAMRKARINGQLANLDGNLCVFGGLCNDEFVDLGEIYDVSRGYWYDFDVLYKPSKDSRILAHNGLLFLVDFKNGLLQCYNFVNSEWTFEVLPKRQLKSFSLAGIGTHIYIIGGKTKGDHVSTVLRYDTVTNKLSEVASLPNARSSVNAHVFRNKIIICGGHPCWRSIQEYNPDIDTWTNLKPLEMNQYYEPLICSLPPWIQ